MKISASIISADLARLEEQITECQSAGVDWIHLDVMDGQFVPNITFGPVMVETIRRITTLPLDVHLMIANPERFVADFARAGADIITVHAEACSQLQRVVRQIKELNKKAGVSLKPATPAAMLQDVLPEIDLTLIMLVNPGFAGQKQLAGVLPKVREVREMIDRSGRKEVDVEVDGGVNIQTVPQLVRAGATVLVAAYAIFKTEWSIAEAVARLRQSAELS